METLNFGLIRRLLRHKSALLILVVSIALPHTARAGAVRSNPGFGANTLAANDDLSTGEVPIGFTINFFGQNFSTTFVNNNGNITFGGPLGTFTPEGLAASPLRIIAPYWADVDTRVGPLVTYGQDTVDGHPAFGVNYVNVGYFAQHVDKVNSFQLVLISREDIGPGNFDIEFNYDHISWETGDASGGREGLGGTSASAGYSNGTKTAEGSFEIIGSRRNGAFLDSNRNGLIHRTLNSGVRGRLVFFVRQGAVGCSFGALVDQDSFPWPGGTGSVQVAAPAGCDWTATSNATFVTFTSPTAASGSGNVDFTVSPNKSRHKRRATLTVAGQVIKITQDAHITLTVDPAVVTLFPDNGTFPSKVALRLESVKGTVNWSSSIALLGGEGWRVVLTPGSGSVTELQPQTLTLQLTPSLLPVFGEIAAITFRDTSDGSFVVVPIIVAPQATPRLNQTAFEFQATEGGLPPLPQGLQIKGPGQGSVSWQIPAGALSSAPWLTFSSLTGSGSDTSTTLSVNSVGLTAGVYQTLVPLSLSGVSVPQRVLVTLNVTAATSDPLGDISTYGISIVAPQGNARPAAQKFTVSNIGGGSLTFQATPSSGGNWLSVAPASGDTGSGPVTLQVTANPAGLQRGIYRGKVIVAFSSGSAQEVQVNLVVGAPAGSSCSIQGFDLVPMSVGNGENTVLTFPHQLMVMVVDSCGAGLNNMTVLADVENTTIVLDSIGNGLYVGTYTPLLESTGTPINFTAIHPTLGTVQRAISVVVSPNPGEIFLPVVTPDAVVEKAGESPRLPLAAGSIIEVFGSGLASDDGMSGSIPLDRQLLGTSLLVGNENAPLFVVGDEEIDAQVPLSPSSWDMVPIVVNAQGLWSAPQNYLIVPLQPGIFDSGGTAVALDSQSRPITAQNPARIGDTLQIFANGLGLVDQNIAVGTAAQSPSALRNPVHVFVGGTEVPVVYQGLAPGLVGTYLIDVVLTSNVKPGDEVPVVLKQDGIPSDISSPVSIPVSAP